MAKAKNTYDELMKLAKRYGVNDNALFVASAEQYAIQYSILQEIKKAILKQDDLTTEKEYIKGSANIYANPLVKELSKISDSANRTLNMMLDIILKLGHEQKESVSRLESMMNE